MADEKSSGTVFRSLSEHHTLWFEAVGAQLALMKENRDVNPDILRILLDYADKFNSFFNLTSVNVPFVQTSTFTPFAQQPQVCLKCGNWFTLATSCPCQK
jgi:hypothetical protein